MIHIRANNKNKNNTILASAFNFAAHAVISVAGNPTFKCWLSRPRPVTHIYVDVVDMECVRVCVYIYTSLVGLSASTVWMTLWS